VKESVLIRICILGSVAGIVALYFISFMIAAEGVGAGEITRDYIGRKVKISGVVEGLSEHRSGHIFFEVRDDTGSVDVVIWEDKAEQLMLSGMNLSRMENGIGIEVTGSVEYYKGNLQVVL
jgi:DNA/RNA endonuclease YhcR with UshA esterase domain